MSSARTLTAAYRPAAAPCAPLIARLPIGFGIAIKRGVENLFKVEPYS